MAILIKNGKVVLEDKVIHADILIQKNKIFRIAENIRPVKKCEIIDASRKYIFPGAIDPHTHHELNLGKGRMSSDTFESGTAAALAGGVTTIFDFAHQELPGETLLQAYKRSIAAAEKANNRIFFHGGIMNLTGDLEEQMNDAYRAGVKSFKVYTNSIKVNSEFLFRVIKKAGQLKAKVLIHCEDALIIEYLKKQLHLKNKRGCRYIPASRPDFLEYYSLISVAALAEHLGAEVYIVHLSSAISADFIKEARARGVKIKAETCPQYLLLTDEVYSKKDGFLYTCTPPFRKKKDTEKLWEMLKKEIIEFIATDHCPFLKSQKIEFSDSFVNYVYGLPGIQFSPLIMISEMRKRKFEFPLISRLLSVNASRYFGLYPEIGAIREGSKADLFIYNPAGKTVLSYRNWKINSDFNQFEGWSVSGNISTVIFDGCICKLNTNTSEKN